MNLSEGIGQLSLDAGSFHLVVSGWLILLVPLLLVPLWLLRLAIVIRTAAAAGTRTAAVGTSVIVTPRNTPLRPTSGKTCLGCDCKPRQPQPSTHNFMSLSALRKGGAWSAMKAAQWSGVMAYSCKPCLIDSVYAALSKVKRLLTVRGHNTRTSKHTDWRSQFGSIHHANNKL
jgi:hypothetical protein